MPETEKPAESPRLVQRAEPVTDPDNVPVVVVDDIGPFGWNAGLGRLTLITFRLKPGAGGDPVMLDPIVCARLRFGAEIAVQLHGALGKIIEQIASEAKAKKQPS
jgi:hypothetical protein